MSGLDGIARLARAASDRRERAVMARVASVEGSHYRRPGARMVLSESGESAGCISGGCLESDLARRIPEICEGGKPVEIVYDTTAPEDIVWGLGLGCNGRVRLAVAPVTEALAAELERGASRHAGGLPAWLDSGGDGTCELERGSGAIPPPPALWIGGAGRDAEPLAKIAAALGWRVAIAAPRWTETARIRLASQAEIREEKDIAASVGGAAAVVMNHNFLDDLALLERLADAPRSVAYVGILGPRERTRRLLAAMGGRASRLPSPIHSPAGLDVGAETPEEIALSIVAEIQAVLTGREGGFLRDLEGRIHAVPGLSPGSRSA